VAPPTEGALAPKHEPLRELPGLRKKEKEKTWRDEVQERVRSRRSQRAGAPAPLPLFDSEPAASAEPAPPPSARPEPPSRPEPAASPVDLETAPIGSDRDELMADLPLHREEPEPEPAVEPDRRLELDDELEPAPAASVARQTPEPPAEAWSPSLSIELEPPPPAEGREVERPALFAERLQAGAIDALLLGSLYAVVVYFTSRAAHVQVPGLLAAWPWLAGYLAFLGFAYAAYFSGTTGQTVGKIAVGLRVVDTSGQPPGYLRALARSVVGAAGTAVAGLGLLPMAFDPARRAFHDRLFSTRVVRG
jgi:uncharacterized RDD family membrane protein YckC